MNIHHVKAPFMSRRGQFEEDKQTLVIGLDINALKKKEIIRVYLGGNEKTYYEIDTTRAKELNQKYGQMWTSPRGKLVAILPIKDFKVTVIPEPPKPEEPKQEELF